MKFIQSFICILIISFQVFECYHFKHSTLFNNGIELHIQNIRYVGQSEELECPTEKCLTIHENSLQTNENSKMNLFNELTITSNKKIQNEDINRYCYFDRSVMCKKHSIDCNIDNRPCNSNRQYLDNMYGKHYFPYIAKPINNINNHNNLRNVRETASNVYIVDTNPNTSKASTSSFSSLLDLMYDSNENHRPKKILLIV